MGAPLQKVRPGDPLVIPAATYNALIDTTIEWRLAQMRTQRDPLQRFAQTGVILARNRSGADRERFDVLGIDQPIIAPEDDEVGFKSRIAVDGVIPGPAHAARFVILLAPLAKDAIGPAVVDGVTVARVKLTEQTDAFAEVENGHADYLKSGTTGSAGILWVDPAEDPGLAIVRVGLAGGAASASQWCIVRSVPDDASLYVEVELITFNDSDPWDGGFEFTDTVVPAFCWPGTRGYDFKELAYDGSDANNPVAQVLDLEQRQGGWWVKPWAKVEYKSIRQSAQIRFSDCNPMKTF